MTTEYRVSSDERNPRLRSFAGPGLREPDG
jgi:hypothetical protein